MRIKRLKLFAYTLLLTISLSPFASYANYIYEPNYELTKEVYDIYLTNKVPKTIELTDSSIVHTDGTYPFTRYFGDMAMFNGHNAEWFKEYTPNYKDEEAETLILNLKPQRKELKSFLKFLDDGIKKAFPNNEYKTLSSKEAMKRLYEEILHHRRYLYKDGMDLNEYISINQWIKEHQGACYHQAITGVAGLIKIGIPATVVTLYCEKDKTYHDIIYAYFKEEKAWRYLDIQVDQFRRFTMDVYDKDFIHTEESFFKKYPHYKHIKPSTGDENDPADCYRTDFKKHDFIKNYVLNHFQK